MILENENNIYLNFIFALPTRMTLKILVELPCNSNFKLKFSRSTEDEYINERTDEK